MNGVKSDRFFPTHLATSLCSGDAAVSISQSADEKRFLILETNYKIYAYTCRFTRDAHSLTGVANELEIAILNLFVDIRIRYRNLVVGKLDRRNVKAAMEKGISASQVNFFPLSELTGRSSAICRVTHIRKCIIR